MKESSAAPAAINRAHPVAFVCALLACLAAVLWMVGPYLLSLFLGGTLAMLAYPTYRGLRVRHWGPRAAASAVTALMLALVIAPLSGFAILAVKEGIAIGSELAELKEFSPTAMTAALSRWELVRTVIGDPASVNAALKSALQAAGQFTHASVLKLGKGIPEFLLRLGLAQIAFFFFLKDGERFMGWLLGLGVLDRGVQDRLVEAFRSTMISAVLAGLATAVSLGALIAVGFLILGVPGAFLAGALTFIFAWIPLIGTTPALLAGFLYLHAQGSSLRLELLIALGVTATIVDHLVRPLVLKGRTGMHPLAGLVAIVGGIRLFGMLGVFIGPILAAMLLSLLKIWPAIGGRFGMESTAVR